MNYFASRAATGFAIPEWLPTPDNGKYNDAVSRLDTIVYGIIRDRKSSGGRQGTQVAPVYRSTFSLMPSSGILYVLFNYISCPLAHLRMRMYVHLVFLIVLPTCTVCVSAVLTSGGRVRCSISHHSLRSNK